MRTGSRSEIIRDEEGTAILADDLEIVATDALEFAGEEEVGVRDDDVPVIDARLSAQVGESNTVVSNWFNASTAFSIVGAPKKRAFSGIRQRE